ALRAFENPSWLRADAAQGTFRGARRIPFSRYRAEPQNSRVAHPCPATNPKARSVRLTRHSSSRRLRITATNRQLSEWMSPSAKGTFFDSIDPEPSDCAPVLRLD